MSTISMLDLLAIEKEGRRIGATEALSRLREKVAEQRELIEAPDPEKSESWSCQDFVEAGHAKALDDVLALIDGEAL